MNERFRIVHSGCSHGANWIFQPVSLPNSCVVCVVDHICDKAQPTTKRTRLLSELTSCLTSGSKLVQTVCADVQFLRRLMDGLIG